MASLAIAVGGCVPIYNAFDSVRAPEAIRLDMFEWQAAEAEDAAATGDSVTLYPTETPDEWLLYRPELDGTTPFKPVIVNNDGKFLRIGSQPEDGYTQTRTLFSDDPAQLDAAGISYEVDDRSFPRVLEVESWARAIVFAPLFPFYGKSTGSMIDGPAERRSWFPPRLMLSMPSTDAATLYELPDTDNPFYRVRVMVSDDGGFLFISYERYGTLIALDR